MRACKRLAGDARFERFAIRRQGRQFRHADGRRAMRARSFVVEDIGACKLCRQNASGIPESATLRPSLATRQNSVRGTTFSRRRDQTLE